MSVAVICTETIKPSTPTPSHKKHLQLSFLDQTRQAHFAPAVYFYPRNNKIVGDGDGDGGIRTILKKSLADTLTWYYPLAGRIKDKTVVVCNDEGVPYFETRVTGNLREVAEQRNHAIVNSLTPFSDNLEDAGEVPLAIQVNFFGCGGIAIGVSVNHVIGDALSKLTFVKFWGAVARGDHNRMACPQFGLANVFPHRGSIESHKGVGNVKEKGIVGRSFLFTKSSLSALKIKYGTRTSAEALITFLLTRFISTISQKRQLIGCASLVTVNLRPRLNPPLPDSHFGNVSEAVGAFVLLKDETSMSIQEQEGYGSLTKIRAAIGKAGSEVIKKLQEGDMSLTMVKDEDDAIKLKKYSGKDIVELLPLVFASLSKFSIYDTDFGWGRPIWVTIGIVVATNLFILLPTPSGDGIEVQFCSSADDLKSFETDKELLAFATLAGNPNLPILSSL